MEMPKVLCNEDETTAQSKYWAGDSKPVWVFQDLVTSMLSCITS